MWEEIVWTDQDKWSGKFGKYSPFNMNGAQSQDGLDDRLEQVSSIPLTCCPRANLDAEVGHLQP